MRSSLRDTLVVAVLLAAAACSDAATSPTNAPNARPVSSLATNAAAVRVFGPERFTRSTGAPVVSKLTLPVGALVSADPPFVLRLINGPSGTPRSSNVTVTSDGIRVVSVSDVSQKTDTVERQISLTPSSWISVEMRGAPGSTIEISIDGVAKPEVAPTLLSPAENARIQQNNPATGCPPNPVLGYGFRIHFAWTPAISVKQVSGYELFAGYPGAVPLVDAVVPDTGHTINVCGSASSLDGWQWRVRARYSDGTAGPWSTTGTFGFDPLPPKPEVLGVDQRPPMFPGGATQVSLSGTVSPNTSATVLLTVDVNVALNNAPQPFGSMQFFWLDGGVRRLIGVSSNPIVNQTPVSRVWTYSFFWDPAPPVPVGALSVIGVGTDNYGTEYTTQVRVVTVVP